MSVNDSVPPFPVVPVAQISASDFQPRHWQGGVVFQQLVARPFPGTLALIRQRPHALFKLCDPPVSLVKKAFQSFQRGHWLSPLLIGPRVIRLLRRFASSSPSRRTAPCRVHALPAI